ncbi:LysR family transcriptional regulator [Cupriavidus basilensis]|uniref:LysR family transcriptional regulator n=1 Tax=Cupriavidus basilensis TaxID=68895 RepID=A0A643FXQ0_9BURK|nr:LysR family transcriptional regulator [Cupriavidus basilensis]
MRHAWHGLRRDSIRHLRFLELVAEHGSLSTAAEQLALSQPAATKMLQDLEAAFGAELVARNTRGAALAPAGLVALDRLRIALSALAAAAQSMEEAPPIPVVRLGVLPLVGVVALPKLLAAITERPDSPRLVVHESTVAGLLAMLSSGDLDCMVGRVGPDLEEPATSELLVTPLWDERLAIACALDHPVGRKRMVGLAELRELDWVVAPRGAHTRQVFEEPFLSAGILPPRAKVESFSFHTNLCVVTNSRLLTVAPESAVRHYAQLGMVCSVRHGISFPAGRTVFIMRKDMAASPSVMQIREDLISLMSSHSEY